MKVNSVRKDICIIGICLFISITFLLGIDNFTDIKVKANESKWQEVSLSTLNNVINKSDKKLNYGKVTLFDYYSDSQVENSNEGIPGSITDGNVINGKNTFTNFNDKIKEYYYGSKNDNASDDNIKYPLYTGLFYSGNSNVFVNSDINISKNEYNFWLAANSQGTGTNGAATATQGLVNKKLDDKGNITIGKENKILPFFNSEFILNTYYNDHNLPLGNVNYEMLFPFRKEDNGYYYFYSEEDVVRLTNERLTYNYGKDQVYDMNNKIGFFPFNSKGGGSGAGSNLNFGFGMKLELSFNMTNNGKIDGENIIFEFTGDDDVWVFIDDYLVLDIGGAHGAVHGKIDFYKMNGVVDSVKNNDVAFNEDKRFSNIGSKDISSKTFDFSENSLDPMGSELYRIIKDTSKTHKLTMFFIERGTLESNLKIKYNLPEINTFLVGNEVDVSEVNKAFQQKEFWEVCNKDYFNYEFTANGERLSNSLVKEGSTNNYNRNNLEPIGLDSFRETRENNEATLRIKFNTFTDDNYYCFIVNGTNYELPENKFLYVDNVTNKTIEKSGYIFKGWSESEYDIALIESDNYKGANPSVASKNQSATVADKNYYAIWAKKDVTISYYDGDKLIGSQQITNETNTNRYELKLSNLQEYIDNNKEGYKITGWSKNKEIINEEDLLLSYIEYPICNINLYAVWEKDTEENIEGAIIINSTNYYEEDGTSYTNEIIEDSFNLDNMATSINIAANEKYQVFDSHLEGGVGIDITDENGEFFLLYDRAIAFSNAFKEGCKFTLKQKEAIYKNNNGIIEENTLRNINDLYETSWELRDLYGVKTSKVQSENGKKLINIRGSTVYDGKGISEKEGFEFKNELVAENTSNVTDLVVIFKNKVKTGSIKISKSLTEIAEKIATRRNEIEEPFQYKVYFKNIFGGESNEKVYIGEYSSIDKEGNETVNTTDENGTINIKSGEAITIKGIPIETEYKIVEINKTEYNRKYYISTVQEENLGEVSYSYTEDYSYFTGKIEEDKLYNFQVVNDIEIAPYEMVIEKIIDELYYGADEDHNDNKLIDETNAKQSFIFNISYIPSDLDGNVIDNEIIFNSVISFSKEDIKDNENKYVKNNSIKLNAGYYKIVEDVNWSFKYDFNKYTIYDNFTVVKEDIKNEIKFAIGEFTNVAEGYEDYIIVSKPKITIENKKNEINIRGDTDIIVNEISP